MTREEAIKLLKEFALRVKPFYEPQRTEYPQAIHMAIEALTYQNLSKPNNTCEVDLISKADAIEVLCKSCRHDKRYWRDSCERKGGDAE